MDKVLQNILNIEIKDSIAEILIYHISRVKTIDYFNVPRVNIR